MPAIRINTKDKDLEERTFRTIQKNYGFDYLPEGIYVVKQKDLDLILAQDLPIEVLNDQEVKKSITDFKRKEGLV